MGAVIEPEPSHMLAGGELRLLKIGMDGFGASAPAEALFPHFGITPEKVAQAARSLL